MDATMPPALQASARRHGGLFTTAQAIACGYSEAEVASAVRAGNWTRLRRGVLIETSHFAQADERAQHVAQFRAVLLSSTKPTFASHLTGAVVHGLPLVGQPPALVSVTHRGLAATRVRAGVKYHTGRVDDDERCVVGRLPCLTLARTVADVARTATFDQAVVIADAALRSGMPHEALASVAQSCANWPGARQLSRVTDFAQAKSESVGESISRIRFAGQGLPAPELQVEVYDADGLVGRSDFMWKQFMTIAEFDGRLKYASADPGVLYAEKRREDRLREAGYEVVRFSWYDIIERPEWVAARIRAAFARYLSRTRAS